MNNDEILEKMDNIFKKEREHDAIKEMVADKVSKTNFNVLDSNLKFPIYLPFLVSFVVFGIFLAMFLFLIRGNYNENRTIIDKSKPVIGSAPQVEDKSINLNPSTQNDVKVKESNKIDSKKVIKSNESFTEETEIVKTKQMTSNITDKNSISNLICSIFESKKLKYTKIEENNIVYIKSSKEYSTNLEGNKFENNLEIKIQDKGLIKMSFKEKLISNNNHKFELNSQLRKLIEVDIPEKIK